MAIFLQMMTLLLGLAKFAFAEKDYTVMLKRLPARVPGL